MNEGDIITIEGVGYNKKGVFGWGGFVEDEKTGEKTKIVRLARFLVGKSVNGDTDLNILE
jgi:hypothetical protein